MKFPRLTSSFRCSPNHTLLNDLHRINVSASTFELVNPTLSITHTLSNLKLIRKSLSSFSPWLLISQFYNPKVIILTSRSEKNLVQSKKVLSAPLKSCKVNVSKETTSSFPNRLLRPLTRDVLNFLLDFMLLVKLRKWRCLTFLHRVSTCVMKK